MTTSPTDQISEKLHEAPKDLELLLEKLREKVQNSEKDEEKAKYSVLVQKLEQVLSAKKADAMQASKDIRAHFQESLTEDQKALLVRVENAVKPESIKAGAEKAAEKAEELGQQTSDKLKEMASSKSVQDMKDGAKELVNEAKKIGSAAEFVAKLDFLADNLESKGGFYAFIAGIVRLFSGMVGFFVPKQDLDKAKDLMNTAKKTVEDGKKTAEAVQGDVEQAITDAKAAFDELSKIPQNNSGTKYNEAIKKCKSSVQALYRVREKLTPEQRAWLEKLEAKLPVDPDMLMDKEKREKWIETQVGPVSKKIADEFYAGGNLSDEQVDQVRKGLKTMHFGQDTVSMLKKRIENPNDPTAVSMSDASSLLTELLLGNADMLGIMFHVVPLHRFIWTVAKKTVSEGKEVYEYNLSLVFNKVHGVNPPEIKFTSDSLVSAIGRMKDDPVAQDIMLMQMYRVNGLFASIAGAAVGGAYSALYMLVDNSHGADGFKDFRNVITKKYGNLAQEMERIEHAFAGNSKFNPGLSQSIRYELEALRKNWLIISLSQEGGNDATKIAELLKKPEYASLGLSEADLMKNSNNVRGFLAGKMSSEGANAGALSRLPGRMFGTAAGAGGDFIDHLQDAKRFQVSIMKGDFFSRLKEMGGSLKILTLARHADKTLLYFKDVDSATNTLRQLGAHGGSFLSELLRSLPTISLVIGGVDLATQDSRTLTASEKWKSFLSIAATVLLPFGAVTLLTNKETAPRINKDGQIENIGTGIASLGAITMDGFLLANALRKGKPVDFLFERPRDVMRTVRWAVRIPVVLTNATARLANPEWLAKSEEMFAKIGGMRGKIAAALLAAGAAGYAYASTPDSMQVLESEGYWDAKSGDITQKTKDAFIQMSPKDKKGFADTLSHAIFDRDKSLPQAKSYLDESGVYCLVANTEESAKKWGTALSQKNEFFSEELAKLGLGVEVIDQSAYDKKKEKTA